MNQEESGIALLDHASRLPSNASTFDELESVRDVAESARTYAKAARLGLELKNLAAEVRGRAERKVGVFLSEIRLHGGDRRSRRHRVTLKLQDLGITKEQSKRWQLLATVPKEDLVEFVRSQNEQHRELTARGVLRLAAQLRVVPPVERSDAETCAKSSGHALKTTSALVANVKIVSLFVELSNHLADTRERSRAFLGEDPATLGAAERRLATRLVKEVRYWLSDVNSQRSCRTCAHSFLMLGPCERKAPDA